MTAHPPPPAGIPRQPLRETRAPHPRLMRARRLNKAERRAAEQQLGFDLGAVRIHSGPVAHALADQTGALAFTHGNHIVLGARAEAMSPMAQSRVLAHELIHVIQQAAPPRPAARRHERPEARGPPIAPMIRAPPQIQCLSLTDLRGYAGAATGTVMNLGTEAVAGAVGLGEKVGDATLGAVREAADRLAPGLWDFLNGGALDDMAGLLCQGVDLVLGTVFDGIADIDIMTSLEQSFQALSKGVTTVQAGATRAVSQALGALFQPIADAIGKWGDPLISHIETLTKAVSGGFTSAWKNVAVPVLDFLEAAGGVVWQGFKDLITWLWRLIAPLRSAAAWAWERISAYFEIAWNSTADIRETLADFAAEAFESFLELIEPIKTPLMIAGGILLVLSPLGPIVLLTQIVPPLYDKVTWLVQNWNKVDIVVEARQYLHDVLLPGLIGLVDGVKSALVGVAVWLAGVLGQLATAMVRVVSAFSGKRCLKAVNRIIAHIDNQVTRFQTWANNGFAGLNQALAAAFDALRAVFQPILDFLARLLIVAANPLMLPVAITAAIWLLLPSDKLKAPVVRFVLRLILAAIRAVPAFLPGLFPLASVMKAGVIGMLTQISGEAFTDDQRISASNKIANLATGGGASFVAGMVVGILKGLIDGIIDPFKLLFMLFDLVMKGIAVVGRLINRLVTLLSPAAATWMQSAVRSAVGPPLPATGDAAQPQAQGQQAATEADMAASSAGQTGQATIEAVGTSTISARDPPETARDTGPAAAPASDAANSPDPSTDRVRREIHAVRPAETQPRAPGGGSVAPPAQTTSGQISARQPQAEITRASTANINAAPVPADAEAPTSADTQADQGAEIPLESELTDEQIVAHMSPGAFSAAAVPAAEGEISATGLEQGMRGEISVRGSSLGGLAGLLGDAWDALMAGAADLGAQAAGWLMRFLALPDYELGSKLGYLTGMILLEALIAYFTAGGYLVIKQGASIGARLLAYFLRFLDMGGAILGIMGKGLARLRRPIMGGLDAASGFLSRFRFLDSILGRVRGAADWLFNFGDEIGRAADLARRGPADDAAGRGVMGLADDATAGARRGADEVPALLPRAADDVPAGPLRAADDVPATAPPASRADDAVAPGRGAREVIDDATGRPPRTDLNDAPDGTRRTPNETPPTIRNDALRAAEFPQAIALARQIAEINDAANQPIPVVMGALMALKTRYRWIDHFIARPRSGSGVYAIGMVASPETPVDRHYTVFESPAPPAPRAADPGGWRTPPANGRVVQEGDGFVVYELPDGTQRIRFDAREARTYDVAQPGRNQTDEARAAISPDGRPYVHEGRHRSVGAASGDTIPAGNGGVPGHPEVLDFPFDPGPAPMSGPRVRDLQIDYTVPEMDPATLRNYTDATDLRFTDPRARSLSGPDRDLAEPRRARELANDLAGNPAAAPPTRTVPQPDGGLRADPVGHPPRSNLDAKHGQLAAAITAAHSIVALNDRVNTPVPGILAQLMALKAHYRWIDTFEAQPLGVGRFRFFMIASRNVVGTADLLDLPDDPSALPRGASVHSGAEGTGYLPPRPAPDVVTLPPGARGSSTPDFSALPTSPGRRAPEAPRGLTSDEIAEDFMQTTGGNGAMVPTGRSQNARIPDYPSRTERHTTAVIGLENNRVFGATNEDFFTRYLDEGIGEAAERFDNIAQQVYIRPITGFDHLGRPIYAPYRVRVDNLARDRATGGLQILDAKTTPHAPLTPNQQAGYPLIAANGGRVETPGLPRGLDHMSDIGPTPVSRAIPTTNLRHGQIPPAGRPKYVLEPVEPAGGVGGPRLTPVTQRAHPGPAGPVTQAAEQRGRQVGLDVLTNPPPGPVRPPTAVGEGSLRGAEDAAVPTIRNAAQKAAQLLEALAAARTIITAAKAANLPAPLVLAQLMALKRRYRWIETFRADPTGPTSWHFVLIASTIPVADADLGGPLMLWGTSAAWRDTLRQQDAQHRR